jgi:hypothetical protein
MSTADILKHYENQVVKFQATAKYFEELANQIKEIGKAEDEEALSIAEPTL